MVLEYKQVQIKITPQDLLESSILCASSKEFFVILRDGVLHNGFW